MRAAPLCLVLCLSALLLPNRAAGQIPPGYYAGVDASTPGSLRSSLHGIIDDHQRFPYTSSGTDTWDILELAQTDAQNPGNILDVYRNASFPKQGGGNPFYEREHAWPVSLGFPNNVGSNYPYTDCHALFLADGSYNSQRANKPFRFGNASSLELPTQLYGGAGGGSGTYPGNSNWTSGSFAEGAFEVWGDRRGDLARALFYLDVRYEGGLHGVSGAAEPDLVLTNNQALIAASNTGLNESVAYMGLLSVLRVWHEQDPVDQRERQRNDVIYSFQGNRNPFVDNPQWVGLLYDDPGAFPGQPWINEFHYDNVGTDEGEFVEIAGPAGLDLSGYQVLAYNGGNGAVYASLPLFGVLPDQGGCIGVLSFSFPGLQNGSPDGLVLLDPSNQVVEGLSYEGSMVATSGPAAGLLLEDIGVDEDADTPVGWSLGKVGFGWRGSDFAWVDPAPASPGQPNPGQIFRDACGGGPLVRAPAGLVAQSCSGVVQLSWQPVSLPQFGGYRVYRTNTPGFGFALLTPTAISQPSFTDTTAAVGTVYGYAVTAVDLVDGESVLSAEAVIGVQGGGAGAVQPWINEIHYDNDGADVGEFFEIAGPAGLDLAGYSVVLYNGANGLSYGTIPLSGVLADQGGCRGARSFAAPGLQNGSPDGLALVDGQGQVIEFLSYEGVFTAVNGPAAGALSVDIGVSEAATAPIGTSLQRAGSGSSVQNFSQWQGSLPQTPGAVNQNQVFSGGCAGSVQSIGCGWNPSGSLTLVPGPLNVGSLLQFRVDNPLGTQTPGSPVALGLSLAPDGAFPCGTLVPGFGMSGPGAVGEVLVSLAPGVQLPPIVALGWQGAGSPLGISVPVPFLCSLAGLEFYAQGVVVDPIGPVGIGLTQGLRIQLSP